MSKNTDDKKGVCKCCGQHVSGSYFIDGGNVNSGFDEPCNTCKHNEISDSEFPCNKCTFNINASVQS